MCTKIQLGETWVILGFTKLLKLGFLWRKAHLSKGIRHQTGAYHAVSSSRNRSCKLGHSTANSTLDELINQT